MPIFRKLVFILAIACVITAHASAGGREENYSRNFWNPTYHIQRLNYCTLDGKKCGLAVASRYCQKMGYKTADIATKDNNVGLTNYPAVGAQCKGWQCNGFKLIRCVDKITHKPPKTYNYRSRRFVFPRYDHYRVSWCYADGRECGARAANSYCRRMGYMRAQSYKKEGHVAATKALGNQQLCFGKECSGYSEISCYR